ncbi:hypothetical protein CMV_028541 [Castanea mollissima]|uniref:Uncharacterized protein n=1 Tax=Castanea mollissima TaxID=60419 RepID=A0A8J4V4Z5_9ROSI|nr:hypothetical protein CMV_028541 [Castanea mollissima]
MACLSSDSGIDGATSDSNFSSIQLSVLDENELSNCINRSLEHWFQSYFQGYSSQRYIYNDCFPKCEILEWSCHQSDSLLRIQLPPNLYTNSDWIGIALFATFTVHKHPTLILDNLATEISHGFSCSLRSDMGSWTVSNSHYITDDSQDLMVQNCGYGLVYQQNVGELVQTLVRCRTMFSDNSDLIHQFTTHQSRTKKQSHDDDNVEGETSGTGGSNGILRGLQEKIKQQSHDDDDDEEDEGETSGTGRSNGTLRVPHYQEKVRATCYQKLIDARGPIHYCHPREHSKEFHLHYPYDRFQEYPTEFLDNLEIEIPHHLSCLFDMDIVHEHPTITSDNLDSEISVASDSPNDKPKNEAGCSYEDPNLGRLRRPIYLEQSSRDSIYLEDQINSAQVIYRNLIEVWYIILVFLQVKFLSGSTFIVDPTAILDILNSKNAHHLYCHLESNVGSLEPLRAYCLTKDDVMLLHLGGFMWLSYIPRSSFPDWLNQCNHIEASIVTDCPDLTVVKCGLCLVHQHDEEEFKQTTRHGLASLSDNWGLILHLMAHSRKRNKQNLSMLKDKGISILVSSFLFLGLI